MRSALLLIPRIARLFWLPMVVFTPAVAVGDWLFWNLSYRFPDKERLTYRECLVDCFDAWRSFVRFP